MVSLMGRRREMMQSASVPLITFNDMTAGTTALAEPYGQLKTSNGNHIYYYNRRRNYGIYWTIDQADATYSASFSKIFSVRAGDSVTIKAKNFIVSGAASNSPLLTISYRDSTGQLGGFTSGNANRISISVGNLGDFETTSVMPRDASVNAFRVYMNASGQGTGGPKINFDLEVYKNGTRII